ncbi:MAG TPA: response regulator [bacterium]|nr:response regulator [bacterium]
MSDKAKKILVIDDDPDILELLEYNLKKAGYRVVTAPSGLNAMWGLEEDSRPDVILLDVMMPTLNGLDFCRYIKSSDDFRNIPVVIVSAKGSPEDIRKGLALGADKYLQKSSFTMETLLKEVRDVL